jgi:hypothetical protein
MAKRKQLHHKQVHKERGIWLSVFLILTMIHSVLAVYLVMNSVQQQYAPQTPIIIASLIFISIATIISAIGIWYWKKWGLYLYGIATVVAMIIHLVITGQLLVLFYDIIPPAILAYLLNSHNKWRYFEPVDDKSK